MDEAKGQGPAVLLARYRAALDRLDFEALARQFAPDAVYLSNGVGSLKGRDEILAAFRGYFGRFAHVDSVDTRIEETGPFTIRSHWRLVAIDRQDGRRTSRSGIEAVSFDEAGRIISVEVEDAPAEMDGPPS
jgi:ketosteroid isomerase-like protein